MIQILKNIKKEIYYFFLKIIILMKNNKDSVFLLGTPRHGNLGDQAILYSELKFFSDINKKNVIYVESSFVKNKISFLKKVIKDKIIYIHGGGFLGSIWSEEEYMVRTVLKSFPENKIIVFPQTIYFDKLDDFYIESKRIYENHENAIFLCREKYSYDFFEKNLSKCNYLLVPDIVLYNDNIDFHNVRKDCLFCIRNDKEKIKYSLDELKEILKKNNLKISYTDTVIKKSIYKFNRKKELTKKLKEFSKSKIIITDRLHGMVFCYITKTPCIVLENSSYKVKGLYEWLKQSNFIRMYNEKTIAADIRYLLNINSINTVNLKKEFNKMIGIMK